MLKPIYAVYLMVIATIGVVAYPLVTGYFSVNDHANECLKKLDTRAQDECVRNLLKEAKVNAEYAKAVVPGLPGSPGSPVSPAVPASDDEKAKAQ